MSRQRGHDDGWKGFRSASAVFALLFCIPLLAISAAFFLPLSHTALLVIILGGAALCLPALIVVTTVLRLYPCPRCGGEFRDSFAHTLAGAPSKSSVCNGCGLRFMEPFEMHGSERHESDDDHTNAGE